MVLDQEQVGSSKYVVWSILRIGKEASKVRFSLGLQRGTLIRVGKRPSTLIENSGMVGCLNKGDAMSISHVWDVLSHWACQVGTCLNDHSRGCTERSALGLRLSGGRTPKRVSGRCCTYELGCLLTFGAEN